VASWTANTIVATVPSLHALGSTTPLIADVAVTDLSTGDRTVMTQALRYNAPTPVLSLLTAPSGMVILGQPALVPFAVKVISADGVSPVVGEAVTFTATGGSVQFAACGGVSCTLTTDASGIASTFVTPQTAGAITLQATGVDGTATASFTAAVRIQTATAVQAAEYVAADATIAWTPQLSVSDNFASTTGLLVEWQVSSGPAAFSPAQSEVNTVGIAQTLATVGPLASGGGATLSACVWTTTCATFTAQGVDSADLRLGVVSGADQTIAVGSTFTPVVLRVTDTASHPVAGAVVQIYQTVNAWQPPCPDKGRCPIPPVLASSQTTFVSDANGLLSVAPQQIPSVAATTDFAAATGTQGFLSLTLQDQP
jgi:hypothetical protein